MAKIELVKLNANCMKPVHFPAFCTAIHARLMHNSGCSAHLSAGMDEAERDSMNITTMQITKVVLLFACTITLFMTSGCLVEDRGRYHDHDRAVVVAPAPAVVVRPPVVVVH